MLIALLENNLQADGSVVIPAIYAEINLLSETLFEAQLYDTDEWIFIDRSGRIVDQR